MEGVQDADSERLGHHLFDLRLGRPVEGSSFVVRGQRTTGDLAAEDDADDGARHVLIHTGQGDRLDVEPSLFPDLATQPVVDGFAEFQDAARRFPVMVIAAADEESPPAVIGDDAADADGVAGLLGLQAGHPSVAYRHTHVHELRSYGMSSEAMLTQAIDPASDRPVYKQIADHLREAIGRGRLREGDQLPSEVQLMGHYGVARMTVRSALRVLQAEGLITAEHGRGVYVRARPPVRRLASDRFARRHRKAGKAAFLAESELADASAAVVLI